MLRVKIVVMILFFLKYLSIQLLLLQKKMDYEHFSEEDRNREVSISFFNEEEETK